MNLKDNLIYLGSISLGKIFILKKLVIFFYLNVLVPLISHLLKLRHPNLINIVTRNSIHEFAEFNFFLSDIDTTIVLKDNSDSVKIVKDFLKLKSFFIMLDHPEIYTEEEYFSLTKIQESRSWKIVELFWNIRKINWCKKSLSANPSTLNNLKMKRSMEKSFKKILKKELNTDYLDQRCFHLKDLKHISLLLDTTYKDLVISSYSDFLANDNPVGIYFELSRDQFIFFNSLFPGDVLSSANGFSEIIFVQECKSSLENHERLITLSSIRLKTAQSMNIEKHLAWLNKLGKKIQKK